MLGGEAVDFTPPTADTGNDGKALTGTGATNKVVINYIDQNLKVTDLYWTLTALGKDNGNYLLETNEKFQVTIGNSANGTAGGNLMDALSTNPLGVNKTFNLEIVTPTGAVLSIERTTPAYIDTIMNLR